LTFPFAPSIETLKKWFDYWRKFKGKRVQIYLKSGIDANLQLLNPLKPLNIGGDISVKTAFLENLIGTIDDVVENPFGILLKDVSLVTEETENVGGAFIPMSEITKIYFFKKEAGQIKYAKPTKTEST
jgi:hypothetical protein